MSAADAPRIPGLDVVRPLGSGGYADVYLYEQQQPRMPVAVKVLKREGLTAAIRRQFVDEANTMAQLADHPYIVQVFRSEQTADGGAYLVMKYYPPPNLAVRSRAERMSVEEVLRTGIQLASAVETAHRAGIIHRDIKPANVLVSQYGQPGLTDFGIAGRGGHAEDVDEDVGVSVPWSPPEVLYGQSNGDSRSDVYSLAATLWHLLVGRSPFEQPGGDNSAYALMPRIRAVPVPPTGRADVPVSLERLLAHAMAKDPGSRPQTAIELARGLQSVEQEQRLPRTPVVVLDEQGRTALAEGSAVRPELDRDRTSVRTPASLAAPDPARTPALREPDDVDDGPPTISGGLILGVVGVLVVGLVGALVWALGRDGTPQAQPSAERALPDRRPDPRGRLPRAARHRRPLRPGSRHVHLELRRRRGGRLLPAAGRRQRGGRRRPGCRHPCNGRPQHSVKARSGELVCAQVTVSRKSGVTGPRSAIRCQTAG